ncbi:AAA ATPase domain-containing protein [Marinilactibacillus piezotolerans]|uniref:AAA ATPase domain-containing protein n=1 Tax=Marinilactibacillus piezotolerans TaxID=258723 RepID=A0A1I4BHU1_9LACT|nr:AAA family ATPase [Marinilactibacillus piezotolerans]SFK67516.1 AAA ATPase domain-containing protein [Marinilactibacillus piezotolerans]
MFLRNVQIQNYRKFQQESFSLSNEITLLAGANNSGKTSLINLIGSILDDGKITFNISDIPVKLTKKWVDDIYDIFYSILDSEKVSAETVEELTKKIFDKESSNPSKELLIPPTVVRFIVEYNEDDDIRNFADFIMSLDPKNDYIYFEHVIEPTYKSYKEALTERFTKLKQRHRQIKITHNDSKSLKIKQFKDMILDIYQASLVSKCYYCDSDFSDNKYEIDTSRFRKLFNYKYINAGRTLDDQTNGNYRSLSKNMVDLAKHNEKFRSLLDELPDQIMDPIRDAQIVDKVRQASISGLSNAIEAIAKANGGNTASMVLDIDINEETIAPLLNQITSTKYDYQGHYLNEASQGLGYSNMIYILLQLESYKRKIDPLLVNIFVIEEPESHMHPQMQRIFGKYLQDYYNEKKIQGLISTHSAEMVRLTELKNLRVSRPVDHLESKIYDFSLFKRKIRGDITLDNFYDWFYEIGFPDIVFADRVILYEGDTERLFIRKLLTLDKFYELGQKYIAYVQVGGAYAHKYNEVIEFLKIKTLILTDLDYKKSATTKEDIIKSKTTNATLNQYFNKSKGIKTPTVEELYSWKENGENIFSEGLILVNFQGKEERFSRTLEEAMLAKHYDISAVTEKERSKWVEDRKHDQLRYTIPQSHKKSETDEIDDWELEDKNIIQETDIEVNNSTDVGVTTIEQKECIDNGEEPSEMITIREIVKHTGNSKTDFMYSVILNDMIIRMLPYYIEEGLEWLQQ